MGEPISSSILCPHQQVLGASSKEDQEDTPHAFLGFRIKSRAISAGEVLWPPEPASQLSCCPCASCPGKARVLEDGICLSLAELWGVSPGHRAHSTLSSPHLLSQSLSSVRLVLGTRVAERGMSQTQASHARAAGVRKA